MIAGYPIAKCEYTPENDEYKKFQEELQSRMECDVISDFTNYIWDENYFYDAKYHLTEEGVQLRTEQLIVDIHNWMQKAQLKLEK